MKRILFTLSATFGYLIPALAQDGVVAVTTILPKPKGASAQSWVKLGNSLMQKARNTVGQDFAPASAAFEKALALFWW